MSPTSTNRSPRHRLTDVGDSDLEVQEKPRNICVSDYKSLHLYPIAIGIVPLPQMFNPN
ncbi:MAG: hypothetical protein K2H04_05965 [Bacteroidaceae bacterium]|nr:hypothetical protein [Bacteroidaceae bacterium]